MFKYLSLKTFFFFFIFWSSFGFSEIEKSWKIRTTGQLRISFPYFGKLIVRGWSQDQISARLYYEKDEAQNPLTESQWAMSFVSRSTTMELSVRPLANANESLDPLKESTSPLVLELRVPLNCELELWTQKTEVLVQNISQSISARGESGLWDVKNISSPLFKGYCESCQLKIMDSKGSIRFSSKNGSIHLENYQGIKVFLSNLFGNIFIKNTQGVHSLISKTGAIQGDKNQGSIDFQTLSGMVLFSQLKGEISGRTQTGKVQIQANAWASEGEVGLESEEGDIQLSLPSSFNGWIEAASKEGQVFQNNPLQKSSLLENNFFEKKGSFIKLKSNKGSITVERK